MRIKNNPIFFIFITVMIDMIGIGIIIPVMPQLIENLTGLPENEGVRIGGLLLAAYAAMQFLFSGFVGELSDRFGRRPVLLLALLGLGVDYLFHAVAPTVAWLLVGRLFAGMCGASYTTAMAFIADVSKPEEKVKNFGVVGAAFGLGFIIGPMIGGFAGQFGVTIPFFVAAGLSLVNATYGFFVLPESLKPENRRPFDWKRAIPGGSLKNLGRFKTLYWLFGAFFLIHFASHSVHGTWSFFTADQFGWGPDMIGISLTVVGLTVALIQGVLIRRIVKWLGDRWTVLLGAFCWFLGLLLFGIASNSFMMFLFILPYCLGGIASPTLQSILSNQIPDNQQGELQGAMTGLTSLTAVFGPFVMAEIFARFSVDTAPVQLPGAAFLAGALLIAIAIVMMVRPVFRLTKPKLQPADSESPS